MRRAHNRAEKLALLSKIVEGRLTNKVVSDIRKSREPMYITLDLTDGENVLEPNDPTYHIEVFDDWKHTRCYWQYADGRIEEAQQINNYS
ncbi:hypothetical protein [Spirosoma arcticum]